MVLRPGGRGRVGRRRTFTLLRATPPGVALNISMTSSHRQALLGQLSSAGSNCSQLSSSQLHSSQLSSRRSHASQRGQSSSTRLLWPASVASSVQPVLSGQLPWAISLARFSPPSSLARSRPASSSGRLGWSVPSIQFPRASFPASSSSQFCPASFLGRFPWPDSLQPVPWLVLVRRACLAGLAGLSLDPVPSS